MSIGENDNTINITVTDGEQNITLDEYEDKIDYEDKHIAPDQQGGNTGQTDNTSDTISKSETLNKPDDNSVTV